MRELEFRAWNGKEYIPSKTNDGKDRLGWFFSNTKGYPIFQYTGFVDNNGRKIFEGDIVKAYAESGNSYKYGWFDREVEWCDGGFCVNMNDTLGAFAWTPYLAEFNQEHLEIVGNIYEK